MQVHSNFGGKIMKKLLAMLLAVSMLLVLVACSDDPEIPISPDDSSADSSNTGGDTTQNNPASTDPEEYQPDLEAKYGGAVGVGTETGVAYFDVLKVTSKQSNRMTLLEEKLEDGALPTFNYWTSVGGDWDKDEADIALESDPLEEYDEETEEADKNHVIAVNSDMTGAAAIIGETNWNYYQYSLKVLPANENSVINVYFCVQDENNYFVLSLGEESNTKADCYQVIDGVKATAAFKIGYTLSLEEWTPIGITVNKETIDIYLDGACKLSLFNPDFENQYYDYDGETVPSSITEAGYGAPGEGLTYFLVDPANVIHDGKGTWGNSTSNIATKAFDMDISTFYDCDEKAEYENTDDELVGIPGDGTFETSYVGAYLPEGVKLTHIRYAPRSDQAARMPGGIFQASVDGETWVDLYTIEDAPTAGDYATISVGDGETVYYYVRYVGASSCYGNVAEIEIWGYEA